MTSMLRQRAAPAAPAPNQHGRQQAREIEPVHADRLPSSQKVIAGSWL